MTPMTRDESAEARKTVQKESNNKQINFISKEKKAKQNDGKKAMKRKRVDTNIPTPINGMTLNCHIRLFFSFLRLKLDRGFS